MRMRTTRNLHVPLPDPMYRQLRIEAQRSNRPATDIARDAIDRWLADQQRIFVHESVAEYARDAAGSPADLDEHLESAAIASLLAIDANAAEEPSESSAARSTGRHSPRAPALNNKVFDQ